jgi:hypothetical protein
MSDTPASHSTRVVGDALTSPPGRSRVVQIMHGQRTGLRFLDAHEIPERDFNVVLRGGQDNNTQRWVLTDTGGGLYTIMQVSSDRYLDAHEIESLDFRVVTRPRQDNDMQLWRLLPSGGKVLIQQVSSGRALEPYLTQDMDFQVVTRPRNDNDDNQWLWEPLFDAFGRTFAVDRSAQFNTPPAAGAPTAWLNPGLGVENIAYRTTALRLHLLTRDALGVTFVQPLTDLARTVDPGTPLAVSSPFGFVDTNRTLNFLLYVDQARMVHSLSWSTHPVGHDNLSGAAGARKVADNSNPVGYYIPVADIHHVIYRADNNHLYDLRWDRDDAVNPGRDLTGTKPVATGNPTAFVNATGMNFAVHRSASDGHIRSLNWLDDAGEPGLDDLSGVAGTPAAKGDPVGYYTAHDDTVQIVYHGGDDGHLYELYSSGNAPVVGWDITPQGAPKPTGTLAAYYNAGTNTKHVNYYSADDHRLHEIWWVPGEASTEHIDLTAEANEAPAPEDRPAAFTVDGPNSLHVAYRGPGRHIFELRRWWL